ncbi:MAG: hypothetical protein R3304_02830 [Longimicrobiales bacterium]|nr:hypothetical protein [Longimicrobiales bacterium]
MVARKMAFVAAILVLPLLVTLTLPQTPYGLGPFGEAWWITLLTTVLGVAIFADAVVTLVRFLSRVRRALRKGYTGHVIALVVSDREQEHGFLLQGMGPFTPLAEKERKTVALLRFLTPFSYLLAASWFVLGFGVLILLAARGWVSVSGVGFGTVAPAALIGFSGLVLRGTEGTLSYRAREAWHPEDWEEDLARHEIEAWRAVADERELIPADASTGSGLWSRILAVSVIVGAFLVALPVMTFVPAASIGAIFTSFGGWGYHRPLQRRAEAEAYRSYRLEGDGSLSAIEAGELVQSLAFAGRDEALARELSPPATEYPDPWLPEDMPERVRAAGASYWTDTLWSRVELGLSSEESEYLRRVVEHPGHAGLSRLARATSVDLVGAYYALPFGDDETLFSLPLVHVAGLRTAADAHLGRAAYLASQGRHEEAEEAVREVISVGLLLADEAALLMANLVGTVLVRRGGVALGNALELRGDTEAAEALRTGARSAQAAATTMMVGREERPTGQAFLERLPEIAEDPHAPLGMRWDMVHVVRVLSPCANLRRVVFGPDDDYYAWLDRVRSSLVRYESEEAFFELILRGIAPLGEPGLVSRMLAVPMGGLATQGSCAQVLAAMPEL